MRFASSVLMNHPSSNESQIRDLRKQGDGQTDRQTDMNHEVKGILDPPGGIFFPKKPTPFEDRVKGARKEWGKLRQYLIRFASLGQAKTVLNPLPLGQAKSQSQSQSLDVVSRKNQVAEVYILSVFKST